jgi:protein-disulfide isomerase
VGELTSAPVPPVGADEHVRGDGPEVVLYMDLACPHCAASWLRVRELPLRICVRHFPLASRRPRAPALHAATEAAAAQDEAAFWAFWDSLYADRGHQDDPHLWARAEAAGLDLDRFERDRRSAAVAERVQRDFRGGIRAGVAGTPSAFVAGEPVVGDPVAALTRLAG